MVDESQRPDSRPADLFPLAGLAHLGFEERLRCLLQAAVDVTGAAGGVVWLAGQPPGELVARTRIGAPREGAASPAAADGPIGATVREGRPAWIGASRGEASPLGDDAQKRAHRSLILPLVAATRTAGAVQLEFAGSAGSDQFDHARLALLVDHLATVAEAAQLVEETRARHAELQRKNAELHELERLKGDFLSMVSHELRTPLTAIIGYTDLLLRGVHGSLNGRQEQHQQAVKKAANRLLTLINDVLDVTRLESGHVELTIRPLALGEAFERALDDVQLLAAERQVELRLDVPTRLPVLQADPERMNQVLVNLMDNAIKFTSPGGRVSLRAEWTRESVHVCVVDTGAGIPAEQIDRIWDRFHQVDSSTRRRFGGTGLGLAIVRNLVQLHGGSVSAQSEGPGQGSTFCVTLPADQADVQQVPALPAALPAVGVVAHRRRVLIVDDEPDNREIIASVVGDLLGHQPILAENGEQALELARQAPDLILLDLRLPGLSGFEIASALKADGRTAAIPIVAITALADRDDRDAALAAGCIGCVTKPFAPTVLSEAVVRALEGAEIAPDSL